MSIIQNYVGLDGKIEAIVRSLMGDVDVDLTDYYTKEEVDALIASGGTGTQIDYNDLLNRPIINGLIQSNLDMKNYLLLKNGTTVYLPTVSDDTVRFDKNAIIPNMYTKTEVDDLISGATPTIDAYTKEETNNLLALKANSSDVYPKTETYNQQEIIDLIAESGGGTVPDPLTINRFRIH